MWRYNKSKKEYIRREIIMEIARNEVIKFWDQDIPVGEISRKTGTSVKEIKIILGDLYTKKDNHERYVKYRDRKNIKSVEDWVVNYSAMNDRASGNTK